MKSISKFISLALLIAAATACNTKEIDKPDIPDQPQISGNVKFTASMKQTRVEYSVNGDKLHQCWEVNDVIYGFYGDNPVGKVTLKVTEVDADTEYATLEATDAEEGAAFIAALKEKGKDLEVGLLYTGRNNESVSGNTIYVRMQNQSTGKIPAYLVGCLDKIVKDEESGDTFVYFDFENECAILEIQSLTGITETIDLASIEISGVEIITSFEYYGGSFGISTTPLTSVMVSGSLKVDSNGNIVDAAGNRSCIRIAVKATSSYLSTSTEITVTATANDASSTEYSSKYKGVLHPGCYIICAKDVVAKTEDGFYFTTVNAAFSHAAELSGDTSGKYDTAEENIVTLVRDCGLAGVTKSGNTFIPNLEGGKPIEISDYNVTFDLNGHTLTLDENEYINVSTGKTLIVKDSSESTGKIQSGYTDGDGYHLIYNYGTVQIEGGQLSHNKDWAAVSNNSGAILNVIQGELSSGEWNAIANECGTVNISGGKFSAPSGYAIINWGGSVSINGGTVSSTIYNKNDSKTGILNISDGTVNSGNACAIISESGTVNITGGVIGNNAKFSEAIQVLGGTECTISGGVIYSLGEQACAIGCRSENGGNPELTILPKASSYEPVIYSAGVYSTTFPISAYMSGVNYAEIIIKGGCLISNSTYNAFYSDDEGSNLILGKTGTDFNFGGFYSNVPCVITNGQTIYAGTTLLDLNVKGGIVLPNDASSQHYGAIPQTDDTLISAIEEILEEGTGEEVSINNIYLIQAAD